MKKLVSAPEFRLKGGGWYETDFKSDKENKRNLAVEKEPEATPRAESKPAAKPAEGKAADAKPARNARPPSIEASRERVRAQAVRASPTGIALAVRIAQPAKPRSQGPPARARRNPKPRRRRAASADERTQAQLEPATLSGRRRAGVAADPRHLWVVTLPRAAHGQHAAPAARGIPARGAAGLSAARARHRARARRAARHGPAGHEFPRPAARVVLGRRCCSAFRWCARFTAA